MRQNLFDRFFFRVLLLILITQLLSLASFFSSLWFSAAFLLVVLSTLVLGFFRLDLAFLVLSAELFVGAQGRLLSLPIGGFSLSLRMGFFASVVALWLLRRARKGWELRRSPAGWWLFILMAIALLGVLLGLIYHNRAQNIYLDANSFLFLAIAPCAFDLLHSSRIRFRFLQVLAAALVFQAFQSLVLLGVFSHGFAVLPELYHWLRDTRMYEVTLLSQNYFRIFSQAQMFSLFGFFIFFARVFFDRRSLRENRSELFLLAAALLTLILSLSRSFWLALGFTVAGCVVWFLRRHGWSFRRFSLLALSSLGLLVIELTLITFVANFPYFYGNQRGTPLQVFEERTTNIDEPAAIHRFELLGPLVRASFKHPFLGSGFGTTITFRTVDPRIIASSNGIRTTFAFEWGFLDLTLKLGLLGLAVFASLFISLMKEARAVWHTSGNPDDRSLALGLFFGLVALYVTHTFSPYLNHPIGFGYMIFMGALLLGARHDLTRVTI